jgi:AraC-like DNA-binding protein
MTSNLASIPSNYSRLIARVLKLHVQDLNELLRLTQLSSDEFLQEETLLTAQQQIQILHNALRLSNDAAFGLRLGKQLTPPTHGAMGFLANSSPDLLTAVKAFQAFSPTRMSFTRLEIKESEEWLTCYYYIDIDVSEDIRRCLSEASAMVFFECAEFILGRPLDEAVTSFDHTAPSYLAQYQQFLPGHFHFSAPQVMIKVPMSVCRIPNVSANHENYLLALRQCEVMLAQLHSNKNTYQYQVQKMMLSHPPGVLCEEEAAAALFVSKRTLARKLTSEGTGFRQIREEILSQQSAGYLRDSNMSVDAIAALLNYHDSSNFRRAFKRWFKLSPDQYRQTLTLNSAERN